MNDTSLDHFLGAKPSSRLRRAASLGLLAVATVAAVALFVRFLVGSDVPYYTALAERDDFTPVLTARGEIRGQTEITVNASQDGVIITVPGPAEGAVSQGRELAVFDPVPITRAVLADRTALADARAALGRAEIGATALVTRLERYERVWHRSDRRAPSLNEMEGARTDAGKARLDLDAARSLRDRARLQLAASIAMRATAAVLAPVNGFVTARLVQPGQYVRINQPLFTLAPKTGGLQVVVPMTAARAGLLAAQAQTIVLIDGLAGQTRVATLAAVLPDIADSAQRRAIFKLDQSEHDARPGMLATTETQLPRRTNVLLVPDAALAFVAGARTANPCGCIYVLTPQGTPRRVDIATGASDGSRTEVLSGDIEPGAKVIIGWRGGTAARH